MFLVTSRSATRNSNNNTHAALLGQDDQVIELQKRKNQAIKTCP